VAPSVRACDVPAARELREALYRLLHPQSRRAPHAADVRIVNRWASQGGLRRVLNDDARSLRVAARSVVRACLSAVATDAVDLLSGPDLARIRECERDHCSMLFLDTSHAGRRRWCDMALCGNREKAAKHRQAHRLLDASGSPSPTGGMPRH